MEHNLAVVGGCLWIPYTKVRSVTANGGHESCRLLHTRFIIASWYVGILISWGTSPYRYRKRMERGVMTQVALIDAMYYREIFFFGLIGILGMYIDMVLKRRPLGEGF
jgi:hypothetical protein